MQKNILILWLGAFGFAVAKHLGENNPELTIYASEINNEIYSSISETRTHPYFFEGIKLPSNIELVANTQDFLPNVDIIISIIPCQFVGGAFDSMKTHLKSWVTILNLSKWIDNTSMQTVSEKLSEIFISPQSSPREEVATKLPSLGEGLGESFSYTYAYLAGGMIAEELASRNMLWADIVCEDFDTWSILQKLFLSDCLDINLKIGATKNTELYAALKNIIALILWYYEWKWVGASSRWYYFAKLLEEIKWVITLLSSPQSSLRDEVTANLLPSHGEGLRERFDFTDYALSWDLIATCFGASRNRYLWTMLWKWVAIQDALWELKEQKKIAEWFETLKWVYPLTQWKAGFEEINNFGKKYISVVAAV